MTLPTLKVLSVLVDRPLAKHYGLELCNAADLPSGSIYPMLARLESAGWLESSWEDIDPPSEGRPRRRYYKLSAKGLEQAERALRAARQSLSPRSPWAPGSSAPGGSPA